MGKTYEWRLALETNATAAYGSEAEVRELASRFLRPGVGFKIERREIGEWKELEPEESHAFTCPDCGGHGYAVIGGPIGGKQNWVARCSGDGVYAPCSFSGPYREHVQDKTMGGS